MPSPSNSSMSSRRSNIKNQNYTNPKNIANTVKKANSSNGSRSRSPKRKNSSMSSKKSKGSIKSVDRNKANQLKRQRPTSKNNNSSVSRSRSQSPPNSPRKVVHKNSSASSRSKSKSRSIGSKGSQKSNKSYGNNNNNNSYNNNSYNNNYDRNQNNNNDFRGRGRGRGRGDRGRGGRGGRGRGGFNNNDRDNNGFNNNSYDRQNNGYNNNNYNNRNNNNNNDFNNNRDTNYNSYTNNNNNQSTLQSTPFIPKTTQQLQVQKLQKFFTQHKQQGWFRQKYHPLTLMTIMNQRKTIVQSQYKKFIKQLMDEKKYQEIDLFIHDYKQLGRIDNMEKEQGQVDIKKYLAITQLYLINQNVKIIGQAPFYGQETDSRTIYIPEIPKQIYRYDLLQECQKIQGFKNLIMNHPKRNDQFKRMGWIEFQNKQQIQNGMKILNQMEFQIKREIKKIQQVKKNVQNDKKSVSSRSSRSRRSSKSSRSNKSRIKQQKHQEKNKNINQQNKNSTLFQTIRMKLPITRASNRTKKAKLILNYPTSMRLQKDLQFIIQIASKLDSQAKIYSKNPLYLEYKFKSNKQKFQIFLLYLRKVHFYEYFQGRFYDSYRTLSVKSGVAVLIEEAKCQEKKKIQLQNQEQQQINSQSSTGSVQIDQLIKLDLINSQTIKNGSSQFYCNQIFSISLLNQQIKTYLLNQYPSLQSSNYKRCQQCRKKFITIDHLAKHFLTKHQQLQTIKNQIIQPLYKKIFIKKQQEWEKQKDNQKNNTAKENRMEMRKKKKQREKMFRYQDYDQPIQEEPKQNKSKFYYKQTNQSNKNNQQSIIQQVPRGNRNQKKLFSFLDI